MKLEDIEASMQRHLYENLQKTFGIKVYEDVISQNFDLYDEWVVIDSLGNPMGAEPIQHYYIHAAIKNGAPGAKHKLSVLVNRVYSVLDLGTTIPVYSYEFKNLIGYMTVSDCGVSPVLQHSAGGAMRSLTVSVVYMA